MTLNGFERGTTVALYASFTNSDGNPVNVSTPKISVYRGGTSVLSGQDMSKISTGFYYYDWAIEADATLGSYSSVFSGTYNDTTLQGTNEFIVLANSTESTASATTGMLDLPECDVSLIPARMTDLIGAVYYYIKAAQRIPVYNEQAIIHNSGLVAQSTFGNWNSLAYKSPVVRKNFEIITSGFSVNYVGGRIEFDKPILEHDTVEISYNFRCFEDCQLAEFIQDAIHDLNIIPPSTGYTVVNLPVDWESTVIYGAVAHALRSLIFKLSFQEKAIIFGGPEGARNAVSNFQSVLTSYMEMWNNQREKTKRGRWPTASAIVVPEYTLPGGRSRWFRYLYK